MKRALALALLLVAGCSGKSSHSLAPTDPAVLNATLDALAAFGPKHVATASNDAAAAYVKQRMEEAGLEDVHYEAFAVPHYVVNTAALAVAVDGTARTVRFDVLEGAGTGHVSGNLLWAGTATPNDLAGKDLTGKVALVQRANVPHRSTQFHNVLAAGAVGMLYVSVAPDNLRQVGSVLLGWEASETAPAFTIGAVDGAALKAALDAGQTVSVTMDLDVASPPGMGHNVVGTLTGRDPSAGTLLIGAHYDSWFAGSVDNGGGVAALLALAERMKERGQPRSTLVFVSYDGEEVGLYGGYDWLRKHVIAAGEPVRAVFNFEVPSSNDATVLTLGHSPAPGVDEPLRAADLDHLYDFYADMKLVPQVFGGIIPTDIQGFYRAHVPTASTAVDSSYYHTTEDTPDKVDAAFLAMAVDAFDIAVRQAESHPLSDFTPKDPALWNADLSLAPRSTGQPLVVTALVTDSSGAPQVGAPISAALLHDDFFLSEEQKTTTDAAGNAVFTFPATSADAGTGSRWIHVTSGPQWPLVESIAPVN